jgi:hypothetical protein
MSRCMLPLALVITAVLAPLSGRAAPPFKFKSVNVDLPDRGTMFSGPGSDAVNNNCLACHSAGMILNQPTLPRAVWQAEVNKMIHVFKAPIAEQDVPAIVDYLTRIKGTS